MEIIFKQVLLKQMSLSFLFFADVFILWKDSAFTLTNASARHTLEKTETFKCAFSWLEKKNK